MRKLLSILSFILYCAVANAQTFTQLSESFEGNFPPQGWIAQHTDGITVWEQTNSMMYCNGAYDGSYYVMVGAGNGDNYLITPKLHPQVGDSLVFYMGIESAGYNLSNTTTVEISTSGIAPEDFSSIRTLTVADFTSMETWHRFALSLSAYAGQTIYLAFHNIISPQSMFGGGNVYLDNVSGPIAEIPECSIPTGLVSTNVTGNSADLSWTSDASEYIVYLRAEGESEYTAYPDATLDSIDNLFPLFGLDENVTYQWYVAAICNDTLNSSVATFRTIACYPLAEEDLPYFTAFDNLDSLGSLPECWTRIEGVEFASGTNVFFPGAFSASYLYYPWITGDTTLYFINEDTSRCWVTLPAVDVDLHRLRVRFSARPYSSTSEFGRMEIGALEAPSDTTSYEIVHTIEAASLPTSDFISYTVSFNNTGISGPGRYICFRTIGESGGSWHVDNLTLELIPPCAEPSNLVINEVSPSTASLSWTPGDETQIQFFLHYRPVGDTAWETLEVFINDSAYVVLEDLQHSTPYEAYVTAPCAPQQSNVVTFTTGCLYIEAENLPYDMDFENMEAYSLPLCWTVLQGHSEYGHHYPCTYEGISAYEGTSCLRFFANATDTNIVALPAIHEDIHELRIKFWLKPGGNMTPYGRMEIGLMSDLENPSSFEMVKTITASELSNIDYQFYKIPFHNAALSGLDKYIVFRCINNMNTASGYAWYVDNLTVEYTPDCIEPENLTVTGLTPTTVDLAWTMENDVPTSCTLHYSELGDTIWTSQPADNALSTTLHFLAPSTSYIAYVTADCAPEMASLPVTFTTNCQGITATDLPKVWDFENDNPAGTQTRPLPICWQRASLPNGAAPYVYTNAEQAYQGTKALYFNNVEGYAILPPIDGSLELNTLQLSFMVRSSSLGNTDYTSQFEVGVMSNPLDISTFESLRSFSVIGNVYTPVEVSFAHYEGQGKYLAIRQLEGTDLEAGGYIDNVVLDFLAECERPYNLHAEFLSADATRLLWNSSSTQFTVYYKSELDNYYTQISNISDTFVVISNDIGGYDYQWYVTADCIDTILPSMPSTFSTPCNEVPFITPLSPMEEGFDHTTIPLEVPPCWVRLSSFMLNAAETYPSVDTIYEQSSWNLLMAGDGSAINLISLPVYSQNLENYRLYFGAKAANPLSGNLEVGVMDYLSPEAEFHVIASLNAQDFLAELDEYTPYHHFVMDLDTVPYHSGWVAFRLICDENIMSQWHLDDFKFGFIPACSEPLNLSADNITSYSADLSWGSDAGTFDILYRKMADDINNVHVISGISLTNGIYTLDSLRPGTIYQWYVRAHCSDTEWSEYSYQGQFTTACGTLTDLPYDESFEYGMGCWTTESVTGTNVWLLFYSPQYASHGNYLLAFPYNPGHSARLVSPVFDLSEYENLELTYNLRMQSYNDVFDSLAVYYRTSATGPWVFLRSHTDDDNGNLLYSISLPNPSSEYQVMFLGVGRNGNSILLDNIQITGSAIVIVDPDSCPAPTGLLQQIFLLRNDASLRVCWNDNAGASQWNLQYRIQNSNDEWTSVTVTGEPCHDINELVLYTTYEIRVQAICDVDNLSEWSDILTATTTDNGIDNHLSDKIILFPNPATQFVDIRIDGDGISVTGMEVYDVYGKRVRTVETDLASPKQTRISVSDLSAGTYFVRIFTEQGPVTKRFLKQ